MAAGIAFTDGNCVKEPTAGVQASVAKLHHQS